jgi:hypothetical protein
MRFIDSSYWDAANHDRPDWGNQPDEFRYWLQLLMPHFPRFSGPSIILSTAQSRVTFRVANPTSSIVH